VHVWVELSATHMRTGEARHKTDFWRATLASIPHSTQKTCDLEDGAFEDFPLVPPVHMSSRPMPSRRCGRICFYAGVLLWHPLFMFVQHQLSFAGDHCCFKQWKHGWYPALQS